MRVFITGITGTLGTALTLLHLSRGDQVFGCGRSEQRASEWLQTHARSVCFYLCDARELAEPGSHPYRILPTMDRVYHCAAMKHVDLCEQNPDQAVLQNVILTNILVEMCHEMSVRFIFVSSDKACMPNGVYGSTKLLGERMVIQNGGAAVRFGNLVGSSGSVFERWKQRIQDGLVIDLTDPEMTRYFIGVQQAATFLADRHSLGETVMPFPMKTATMGTLAKHLGASIKVIGRRPGETKHQRLVGTDEVCTMEDGRLVLGRGKVHDDGFGLTSDIATRWNLNELLALAGMKE